MFGQQIDFNEELHQYFVDGEQYESVSSGVLKKVTPEFDTVKIAERKAYAELKKNNYKPTRTRVRNLANKFIKEWNDINKKSTDRGSRIHNFAESYIKDNTLEPEDDPCKGVIEFLLQRNYKILGVEVRVHSLKFKLAGTFDLLVEDENGDIILVDWKTNRDLFKNYKGEKLLPPFDDKLNQPYEKYVIQLNTYKYILNELNQKVDKIMLVWLDTDDLLFDGEQYEYHTVFDIPIISNDELEKSLKKLVIEKEINNDNC